MGARIDWKLFQSIERYKTRRPIRIFDRILMARNNEFQQEKHLGD